MAPLNPVPQLTNTEALGTVIYTHYVFLFQACGLVLLVAMIGAIVLTLRERATGQRQNIDKQHARTVEETLELVQLPLGENVFESGGFLRPKGSYYETAVPGSYGSGNQAVAEKEENRP